VKSDKNSDSKDHYELKNGLRGHANMNFHIEQLVLEGLPVRGDQGSLIREAVEVELARLLSSSGLTPELLAGEDVPSLSGNSIHLYPSSNPTTLGMQIARSVYASLGGSLTLDTSSKGGINATEK
jgi:hypothetical protein